MSRLLVLAALRDKARVFQTVFFFRWIRKIGTYSEAPELCRRQCSCGPEVRSELRA